MGHCPALLLQVSKFITSKIYIMVFCFSHETGLNLIIETVAENGPAWKCGVRPGDVIVTVDDWLITVMDKPQVTNIC